MMRVRERVDPLQEAIDAAVSSATAPLQQRIADLIRQREELLEFDRRRLHHDIRRLVLDELVKNLDHSDDAISTRVEIAQKYADRSYPPPDAGPRE